MKFFKKGVTLVEVIAVVVIMGVLLVIAVPNILKLTDKAKLRNLQEASVLLFNYKNYDSATVTKQENGFDYILIHDLLNEGKIEGNLFKEYCSYDENDKETPYNCSVMSFVHYNPIKKDVLISLYKYDEKDPSKSELVINFKSRTEVIDAESLDDLK